ncbi:hypothetical protein GOODEAATRI_026249 [Goodea atripinnis]|uniref:Uncharacterized protein n=1 Tax=Goodea atripinnis TaxID=208336 RepID=A0ABV0PHI2_9TELE
MWKNMLWSDVSKTELFLAENEQHMTHTVTQGGGSIMLWRCCSLAGKGKLVKAHEKMIDIHSGFSKQQKVERFKGHSCFCTSHLHTSLQVKERSTLTRSAIVVV